MAIVLAHITGTVWKVEVAVGDEVSVGDTVAIIESMKMEMPVESEYAGRVVSIINGEEAPVKEGDPLIELE